MDSFLKGAILGLVLILMFWYLPKFNHRLYKIHETLITIEEQTK